MLGLLTPSERTEAGYSLYGGQELLRLHILKWWGKKTTGEALDAYRGLSNLYLMDERYTYVDGKPDLAFTAFITKAMLYFADARNVKG